MVRDFTQVVPGPKSEVRSRLLELIESEKEAERIKIKGLDKTFNFENLSKKEIVLHLNMKLAEQNKRLNFLCEEKVKESRSVVLHEVREMIETKLRNDPNNPVLLAGLEYALVVLKNIESQNDQKE